VAIALLGNLPLLSIYLGDQVGPAIIQATTISGTMVMGLAPIFLLAFVRGAGPLSFHLSFWPGLTFGILRVLESALGTQIFPTWVSYGRRQIRLGSGSEYLWPNPLYRGLSTRGLAEYDDSIQIFEGSAINIPLRGSPRKSK
jgi:hypothetical protein